MCPYTVATLIINFNTPVPRVPLKRWHTNVQCSARNGLLYGSKINYYYFSVRIPHSSRIFPTEIEHNSDDGIKFHFTLYRIRLNSSSKFSRKIWIILVCITRPEYEFNWEKKKSRNLSMRFPMVVIALHYLCEFHAKTNNKYSMWIQVQRLTNSEIYHFSLHW